MSTACVAGQLVTVGIFDPGVVFSSASCDLELPYFCAMDVNILDTISTPGKYILMWYCELLGIAC